MKTLNYYDLLEKQREEISNFPIAYAFNEKQLEEALKKLGAEKSECVTVMGAGDILKRKDVPRFLAMLERHTKEVQDALQEDEEWAENAFLYEMDNHEYAINMDGDEDVLRCFGLTYEMLEEMDLDGPYKRAKKWHMKRMHNNGII